MFFLDFLLYRTQRASRLDLWLFFLTFPSAIFSAETMGFTMQRKIENSRMKFHGASCCIEFTLMRRETLSEKPFSARQERRFLDAMGRALLKEFPNPERIGCPNATLLKGIASHKVPLAQADPWLDHLTSCSPCYRDFSQFREAFRRRRIRILIAVVAGVLLAVAVSGWALLKLTRW